MFSFLQGSRVLLSPHHSYHLPQLRELKRDTDAKIYGHASRNSQYKLKVDAINDKCERIDHPPHGKRCEKHWSEVTHLAYKTNMYELARVIGVYHQANDGGEYHAPAHGEHANRYGDAHHEGQHHFLYDLEAEEEIGTPFHLQQVEVDSVDWIPHHRHADNLEVDDTRLPFGRYHHYYHRARHGCHAYHQWEHDVCGETKYATIVYAKPFLVILYHAHQWESDTLKNARDVGGRQVCVNLCTSEKTQLCW